MSILTHMDVTHEAVGEHNKQNKLVDNNEMYQYRLSRDLSI